MSVPTGREHERARAAELEIDLKRVWRSVSARWWLPLIGLVVGALVAVVAPLGRGTQWQATSEVYLGTPIANGEPISSPPTNVGLATAFVNSPYALRHASHASGVPVSRLSGTVSAKQIVGVTGTAIGQPAPLLLITVTGSNARQTQSAADDLAKLVVTRVQPYTAQKITIIKARLAQEQSQIAAISSRLSQAEDKQDKLAGSTPDPRLAGNWAWVISTLSSELYTTQTDATASKALIAQMQGIEQPRIVSPPLAASKSGTKRSTRLIIGAITGLALGLLAAALWDPIKQAIRKNETTERSFR
jgi:hypothetical protein